MNINIESISETQKKIVVEVPKERIDKEFNKLYGELRQKAHIPGFRQGKVPKSILKMRMGDDIAMQIGVDLIEELYPEAVKKVDDETIGQPAFGDWKVEEGKPFVFDFTVEILPEIELKNYSGIEVPKGKMEITDDEINDGLARVQEGQATYEVVSDRTAEKGDRIYGRITMKENGEEIAGWSGRHVEVDVGDNKFFPESPVEENFIGAAVDQEKVFTIEFVEDYSYYRDVAGKKIEFTLHTNDIKAKKIPEIGDDLAKDLGLENLEDLKKMITSDIENRKQKELDEAFEAAIFDKINQENDVPAPGPMVDSEAEFMFKNYFSYQGEVSSENKEKLIESLKPMAEQRVKQMLILQRVAELEKLEATDEDVDEAFTEMAQQDEDDPKEIREKWEEENLIPGLKKQLVRSKAMTWLRDNVKAVELKPEEDAKEEKPKKKAAAKKTTAKKAPAKKKTTEKKTAEKKTATKKAPAKKAPAKKAPVKKKETEKKPAEKKAPKKKAAVKKSDTEKTEE